MGKRLGIRKMHHTYLETPLILLLGDVGYLITYKLMLQLTLIVMFVSLGLQYSVMLKHQNGSVGFYIQNHQILTTSSKLFIMGLLILEYLKIFIWIMVKIIDVNFIENYLNKKPSRGKVLQGKCPDELWSEEFTNKKNISKDALKLFCMRTSKTMTIARNGIYDSQLQLTYWGEWMICEKGRKVFIRIDINAYQEAWVFDAQTEEYLGEGNVYHSVSFLAQTNIEKSQYKKALERKNKENS